MDINRNNYEDFFLLFLDGELSPAENREVEEFLARNTDLQKEFSILQLTVLAPAEILFENKELLIRREEKRRVIPFYKMRIAAAIALLLAGSWFIMTVIRNHPSETTTTKETAATKGKTAIKETSGIRETTKSDQTTRKPAGTNSERLNDNTLAGQKIKSSVASEKDHQQSQVSGKAIKNQSDMNEPAIAQIKPAITDLQTTEIQSGKMQAVLPEIKPAVLALTATGGNNPAKTVTATAENQTDPYAQTDNAISVVALNDRNKSLTGFFKKLTKRNPPDASERKVRVSVFQFSY